MCGSGAVVCSLSLLIRRAQRARCQAETPLIGLFRFLRPALCVGEIDGSVSGQNMPNIGDQLLALCDPTAEVLSDKDRIDRFVQVGHEVATELAELDAFV